MFRVKPYLYTHKRLGYTDGKVVRMCRRGWEVVSISGGGLGGARIATFRRPNPRYKGQPEPVYYTPPHPPTTAVTVSRRARNRRRRIGG